MENKITFDINNGGKVTLTQSKHNDDAIVKVMDNKDIIYDNYTINNGDFVMLLNYYKWIKDNDIQCDFINYNGKINDRNGE